MKSALRLLATLLLLGIAGVAILIALGHIQLPTTTPTENTAGAASPTAPLTSTVAPTDTSVATLIPSPTPSTPITITLWIPADFDTASDILRQHLANYEQRRPNVHIQLRVKALEGEGGMLNSLIAASAAAPDALPTLALMPQSTLESCVLKGVCYPYDALFNISDTDWLDFALASGQMQGSTFGLPFAADVFTLAYRPEQISQPPTDWATLVETPSPLLFYANDPQAAYMLTLYLANGGSLRDDAHKPTLEKAPLVATLTAIAKAHQVGRFPAYLLQYKSEAEVWQTYAEGGSAAMTLVWASQFLREPPEDTTLSLPPTPNGTTYTLGQSWLWALTSPDPQRQSLGAELAAYLTMPDFMAQWNTAAGYFPTRATALETWQTSSLRETFQPVLLAIHPFPPDDVYAPLQTLLHDALEQVLLEKGSPEEIANGILARLP